MVLINKENVFITKSAKDEIERIDFATCKEPSQTIDDFYSSVIEKPDIIVNGGLFKMSTGKPVMDFIDEGNIKSYEDWIKLGIGITGNKEIAYGSVDAINWRDFISGYPVLLVNGNKKEITIATEISYRTRRTLLGYDDLNVYTITIDYPGATFEEAADIALEAGLKYAINLDGGISTGLICKGDRYARAIYNRPLDNVICIYLKKGLIYRVQVGAFLSKTNAEMFKKRIQCLDDTIGAGYKNSYVRLINGLYKVQVGAFSVRQNADKVVMDLRSKGFNPFITTL